MKSAPLDSHNVTTDPISQVRGLDCEIKTPWPRATYERSRSVNMMKHVGLDVHAESISIAVASGDGVMTVGRIRHDLDQSVHAVGSQASG